MGKRKTLQVNTQTKSGRSTQYPRAWENALYLSYRNRLREREAALKRELASAEAARQQSWQALQDPLLGELREANARNEYLRNKLRLAKLSEEALGLRLEASNQRLEIAELAVEHYEDLWDALLGSLELQEASSSHEYGGSDHVARLVKAAQHFHARAEQRINQDTLDALKKAVDRMGGEREFQAYIRTLDGLTPDDMLALKSPENESRDGKADLDTSEAHAEASRRSVKSLADIRKLDLPEH